MENKIKIADIVNRNKGIKNNLLLKEYNEKFDTDKEKFYDENKDEEPLKSKIKQLKNFFVIGEYGLGYYRPEGDEVELAKELCQSQKILGVYVPTELYKNKSDQSKDNETFNGIVASIRRQLQDYGTIGKRNVSNDKTLTDDEIKKIIIDLPLPSFETEFQKKFNITKPDSKEINFETRYAEYNLKEILTAEDFVTCLYKDKMDNLFDDESDLDFILENNVYLNESYSFGLDNIEIENLLFNYLKDGTLNKFDTAEQILNFYYKKLKLAKSKFNPSFGFAYRILKLYDKKLAETNNQNYANKFEQLRECAKECTKDILGKDSGVIQSVKNIFNYVNMFETHRTSQFNADSNPVKQDIVNISIFMKEHLLIDNGYDPSTLLMTNKTDSTLETSTLNLSVSTKEWWKEFFIFLFTHFPTLFSSDFKIEKSAQIRKLVNFLQRSNTNEIEEYQTYYQKYVNNNIKYVYEQTNRFQAFRHLQNILPDQVPQQDVKENGEKDEQKT